MSNHFGRHKRLLSASDYRVVFSGAAVRVGQNEFLLLARGNDHGHHRLGLAVAKKHVRLATTRNRIKRGAREAFRQLPDTQQGLDIIFLTRPGAAKTSKHVFTKDLPRQLQRLCSKAAAPVDGTS